MSTFINPFANTDKPNDALSLFEKVISAINALPYKLKELHINEQHLYDYIEKSEDPWDGIHFIKNFLKSSYGNHIEFGHLGGFGVMDDNESLDQLPRVSISRKCNVLKLYDFVVPLKIKSYKEITDEYESELNQKYIHQVFEISNIIQRVIQDAINNEKKLMIDISEMSDGKLDVLFTCFMDLVGTGFLWKSIKGCFVFTEQCEFIHYEKQEDIPLKYARKIPEINIPIEIRIGKGTKRCAEYLVMVLIASHPNIKLIGKHTGGYLDVPVLMDIEYIENQQKEIYSLELAVSTNVYDQNGKLYDGIIKNSN